MGMNINILAKSTLAILAVVALYSVITGSATNNPDLLGSGMSLAYWLIVAVIIVTIIINLPRFMRR